MTKKQEKQIRTEMEFARCRVITARENVKRYGAQANHGAAECWRAVELTSFLRVNALLDTLKVAGLAA